MTDDVEEEAMKNAATPEQQAEGQELSEEELAQASGGLGRSGAAFLLSTTDMVMPATAEATAIAIPIVIDHREGSLPRKMARIGKRRL